MSIKKNAPPVVTKLDTSKPYELKNAVEFLKKTARTKFVSSVELHLNLLEKGIKINVQLPFGTGKKIRVAIVSEDVLKKLEAGTIDFDVLITEASWMPKLARFAKLLGPKGLMPNPKNGTITNDVPKTISQFSKGQVQVKTESDFPLIHQLIGKIDMKTDELVENAKTIINAVRKNRIKSAYIKTTMSQSIKLDLANL